VGGYHNVVAFLSAPAHQRLPHRTIVVDDEDEHVQD
jgi:hypothetical protein